MTCTLDVVATRERDLCDIHTGYGSEDDAQLCIVGTSMSPTYWTTHMRTQEICKFHVFHVVASVILTEVMVCTWQKTVLISSVWVGQRHM